MTYPTAYVGSPKRPGGGASPGAKALLHGLVRKFPGSFNLGIYNPRDVCGHQWPNVKCALSQHASGRAVDFGIPPGSRPKLGNALAGHLVKHSAALGITEVIWWEKRYSGGAWRPYTGRSPHHDHVHTTLHPDAAARLTLAEVAATFGDTPPAPATVTRKDPDLAMSTPSAVYTPTAKHVFYRGPKGSLVQRWWEGDRSGERDLGGVLASAPEAVADGAAIDVLAKGTNGQLWLRRWDGKDWQPWKDLGGQIG